MNKTELVKRMSEITGKNRKQEEESLKALLQAIEEELEAGGNVRLVGFGTFEVRNRKARKGVNPQNTKERIDIPAKKVPAFNPGKPLKDKVNQ